MDLSIAFVILGTAVIGLIVGIIVMRRLTPDLAAALSDAQQQVALQRQHLETVQRDRIRLQEEAKERHDALVAKAQLQTEVAALQLQLTDKKKDSESVRQQLAAATEKLDAANSLNAALTEREQQLNQKLDGQRTELKALQEQLKVEFENIANRILDATSARLTKTSEEKLTDLLTPLKERIVDFQKKVEETYNTERGERINLQIEIKQFIAANHELGQQADRLANALRGDIQKRGRWGELVLERILESSGLTRGRDYVTQGQNLGLRSEAGGLQRPDAVVYLPENRHIVIDSKVTLAAYERHVEADDVEQRSILHAEFITAVRRHVDDLAAKKYQDNAKLIAHDYVLMFVPIEGALALAMQDDNDLFKFAWDRRVAIVGPTSLLMTLRVVATIWRYQRQGENATKIAERAALIYDKLEGVIDAFNETGSALDKAKNAFENGMLRLATGRGNALSQAEQLTNMGVKPKKVFPKVKIGSEEIEISASDAEHLAS